MRGLFVLGRMLFGGYFLYSGLNHYLHHGQLSRYAASKGVRSPGAAVGTSGALLVAGGASVVLGWKAREGLASIIAFLVPVTLQMHRFWEIEDEAQRQPEMVNFMKNTALAGAALAMMQIEQPWPAGIDAALHQDDEMYVRVGGRDFRALPV